MRSGLSPKFVSEILYHRVQGQIAGFNFIFFDVDFFSEQLGTRTKLFPICFDHVPENPQCQNLNRRGQRIDILPETAGCEILQISVALPALYSARASSASASSFPA